jgi:hypothetical protein
MQQEESLKEIKEELCEIKIKNKKDKKKSKKFNYYTPNVEHTEARRMHVSGTRKEPEKKEETESRSRLQRRFTSIQITRPKKRKTQTIQQVEDLVSH